MKNFKLACLFLLSSLSVFSQGEADAYKAALNVRDNGLTSGGTYIPGKRLDRDIKGSIYLFSNWTGRYKVITKAGDSRQLFNLNYNLKTKKVEAFVSKDSVFQYDLEQFDYVILANNKYKVITDASLNGLMLEVFNSDKIKLFRESSLVVEKGVLNPLTQELISEDKYVQAFTYYLQVDGKYEKIKLSKKAILKHMAGKEDLMKEFVSQNKLSYSSEVDIQRILTDRKSVV